MGGAQSSSSSSSSGGAARDGGSGLESKFRGTGDLVILERAFSHLTASSSSDASSLAKQSSSCVPSLSLETAFGLAPVFVDGAGHSELCNVISHIGPAIVKELLDGQCQGDVNWTQLLQGFDKCSQVSGGNGLKLLFSVFSEATQRAKEPSHSKVLEKAPLGSGTYFDMVGYLTGAQLKDFFWLCWLLMSSTRLASDVQVSELQAILPNIDSLLSGAVDACDIGKSKDIVSEQNGLEKELPVMEISPWVMSAIPGLNDCLPQYIRAKLSRVPTTLLKDSKENIVDSIAPAHSAQESADKRTGRVEPNESESKSVLLQSGIAWAIGLSLREAASEILFRAACGLTNSPGGEYPVLMYRSSVHGKGMNRFWSCVEGYQGLTLFLVSAHTTDQDTFNNTASTRFMVGAIIAGGFENRDTFYGVSGSCLLALNPVFRPLHSTGREKNFVYSHKRTPGAGYRAQPKPEGVGFGGSLGKERMWLNEEFGTLTLSHHAVDKTYQAGSLVPNQGYSPVVANVVDVEVWGLGGHKADQDQEKYLKRQNLFTEQRRKVDLKTMFGTWENSPEKMMMDMVSNPNAPAREER